MKIEHLQHEGLIELIAVVLVTDAEDSPTKLDNGTYGLDNQGRLWVLEEGIGKLNAAFDKIYDKATRKKAQALLKKSKPVKKVKV